jgi:hypothetical protein
MSDPYRNDTTRPVIDDNGSNMGVIAGIVIAVVLIVGGFLYYNTGGPSDVASNMAPAMRPSAPLTSPSRPMAPPSPSAVPGTAPAP